MQQEKKFSIDVSFLVFIFFISFSLAFIDVVLKVDSFNITFSNILYYIILLVPLLYILKTKKVENRYTKYFIPSILILIFDTFYFNNDFVKFFLPYIILFLIFLLYLTINLNVKYLYETIVTKLPPFKIIFYFSFFRDNIIKGDKNRVIYRVLIALFITIPFLFLFLILFMSADKSFQNFIDNIYKYLFFSVEDFFLVILFTVMFILFFLFTLLNSNYNRVEKEFSIDTIIANIFLSFLNILFISFLLFQIEYIFGGEAYLKENSINISKFAREGFFQLMIVLFFVFSIFLFIKRRLKDEKVVTLLLIGLLIETIIIGISSLKKMYLYQSIKGATTLRYYVEWFDYFLLILLIIAIISLIKKVSLSFVLNSVVALGILALTIVSSINVDYIIANHNIKKFGIGKVDKSAIERLSIDAVPALQDTNFKIYVKEQNCNDIREFHLGYCLIYNKYGYENIRNQYSRRR